MSFKKSTRTESQVLLNTAITNIPISKLKEMFSVHSFCINRLTVIRVACST